MLGAFLDCEAGPVGICPRDGTNKVGLSDRHMAMNNADMFSIFITAKLSYKEIPSPHRGLGIFLSLGFVLTHLRMMSLLEWLQP